MMSDCQVPQHDPLSEEMDLITFQEADARLYEELARTRAIVQGLRASGPSEELNAQQARLTALEAVTRRLRAQRTQPPLG
jgi:hypothetical protein